MIPVTEAVTLQRAALERVQERAVIHVHAVAHSHTVNGLQTGRICRAAAAPVMPRMLRRTPVQVSLCSRA